MQSQTSSEHYTVLCAPRGFLSSMGLWVVRAVFCLVWGFVQSGPLLSLGNQVFLFSSPKLYVVRCVFCSVWGFVQSETSSVHHEALGQLGTSSIQSGALCNQRYLLPSTGHWAERGVFCPVWSFEQFGASSVQPWALGIEAVMLMPSVH